MPNEILLLATFFIIRFVDNQLIHEYVTAFLIEMSLNSVKQDVKNDRKIFFLITNPIFLQNQIYRIILEDFRSLRFIHVTSGSRLIEVGFARLRKVRIIFAQIIFVRPKE
ncbi:hypothetical protein Glove_99g314 [Diversispora epigaea]|uniref:Uncharacterized protein n=1 Tax=Diversispora epigaea TaxID=1348612 RepID=A0A397J868_9GLOM|nr:hypothetical protein Glove_99g314 [Diversispora epigaea]